MPAGAEVAWAALGLREDHCVKLASLAPVDSSCTTPKISFGDQGLNFVETNSETQPRWVRLSGVEARCMSVYKNRLNR